MELDRSRLSMVAGMAVALVVLTQAATGMNATAGAAPVTDSAAKPITIAFSNGRIVPTASTISSFLSSIANLYCAGKPVTGTRSLAQAIADARKIESRAGAAAVKAVNASRDRNPDLAELDAAGALTKGNTIGALAALMAAYGTSPKDGTVLRDLGSVMAQIGHPQNPQRDAQDAIALFDRADAVRGKLPRPMGISEAATELNDRGFALMQLRQWNAAGTALAKAVADAPLLSEAKLNLGMVLMCQHKISKAAHMIIAGARRDTFTTVDEVPGTGDPGTIVPAAQIIDVSHGHAGTLPKFSYPQTLKDMYNDNDTWAEFVNNYYGLYNRESTQALNLWDGTYYKMPLLGEERVTDLVAMAGDDVAGGYAGAAQQLNNADQAATNFNDATFGGNGTVWPELQALETEMSQHNPPLAWCQVEPQMATWLSQKTGRFYGDMLAWDSAARAWWAIYSKWQTGVLANIANPAISKSETLNLDSAKQYDLWQISSAVTAWEYNALNADQGPGTSTCGATLGPEEPPPSETTDTIARCPNILKWAKYGIKYSIPDVGSVDISATCEKPLTIKVSGPGILAPFGKLSYSQNGDMTAVLGAKVGVSLGPWSAGVDAGFYVTVSGDAVTDAGITVSGKVGAGDITLEGSAKVGIATMANVDGTVGAIISP